MRQSLGLVSLVVRDYDEAIAFFVGTLGFDLVEDTFIPEQAKRWVVVAPHGSTGSRLLLARDYSRYRAAGVTFVREPKKERYGTVAVFRDLYGNHWDLLEPAAPA